MGPLLGLMSSVFSGLLLLSILLGIVLIVKFEEPFVFYVGQMLIFGFPVAVVGFLSQSTIIGYLGIVMMVAGWIGAIFIFVRLRS